MTEQRGVLEDIANAVIYLIGGQIAGILIAMYI